MTKEILTSENLIEIEENLSKFKIHHQNAGALMAHELVRKELKDKETCRDGSPGMDRYYSGYDDAIKDVLRLIRRDFIK